jgi:hypothetical protein
MKPIQNKVFKSPEGKERVLAALAPMAETHILQGFGHILTNVLNIAAPFLEKEGFK